MPQAEPRVVPATPALELTAVHKRFGATPIIRGVSLAIARGERHAIIGPNGAGKSTLFNLMSGRLPPTEGSIRLEGEEIAGRRAFRIARKGLSRSFQVTNIFPRMSVRENVRCSVLWSLGYRHDFFHSVDGLRDANERTDQVLERIHLAQRADVPAGVLTYAEQRALEIGITIAGGAPVILLDEPTAGMSRPETENAIALIREVTRDRTLVMVEHDMSVIFGLADRITVLVHGEVVASDTPERIRANADVRVAYLGAADA